MNISEQVKELRRIAEEWNPNCQINPVSVTLNNAADTIESLSAKLQAANNMIEEMSEEIENCYGRDTKLTERARKYLSHMEQSSEDCGVWIPCNVENLPDEEVLCCDNHGEMILGYVFEDETSDTGFSAESDNEYMYGCVKWMEKPKP